MTLPLPSAWANAEVVTGLDLIDKAELVGVPFLMTGVQYKVNERGVSFVYVDAENVRGDRFTFNDSSTGVRQQITGMLADRGKDHAIDSGEYVSFVTVSCPGVVAPRGLRVSNYEVQDPRDPRRSKAARTFYLTSNGERAEAPQEAPKRTVRKRATKTTGKTLDNSVSVEAPANAE